MAAAEFVDQIVSQALEIGQQKSAESTSYSQQAITASQGFIVGNPNLVSFTPANVEPPVNIPANANGFDSALYSAERDRIVNDLADQFAGFMTEYFPDECDSVKHAQEWLCKALTEGGTGISAVVEDQIWQRNRARVLNEVSRASDEILSTFSARRFPIPPGAAQHQMYVAQQDAQNQIGQSSRDLAIKQMEIEIENVKFAVQQALEYRVRAISAAGDYIRVLAGGPEIAMRLATSAANAQAQLINAASSYFNARIRLEDLKLEVKKINATEMNSIQKAEIVGFTHLVEARAQVLAAAAKSAGDQAAAALNAVHASAGVVVQGEDTP